MIAFNIRKLPQVICSVIRQTRGVSAIEFALTLPVLSLMGMGGLEMAQYALTVHKVSQAANALADNMSRVGALSALSTTQLRESDVLDGFVGVKRQNPALNITANGRITLSSLELNPSGGQWIHWQRCIGTMVRAPAYGIQGTGVSGTAFAGMGPLGQEIKTPPGAGQAVMFVELAYQYTPMFTGLVLPSTLIKTESAFIVRTPRDTSGNGIFNPGTSVPTPYTCDRHTAS
jgi:TadE-like protein